MRAKDEARVRMRWWRDKINKGGRGERVDRKRDLNSGERKRTGESVSLTVRGYRGVSVSLTVGPNR